MNIKIRLKYLQLAFMERFTQTLLPRTLEPSSITDQQASVDDYNRAAKSVMILPYVVALNMVHQILAKDTIQTVVDLCCGPGHFTRMLAHHLICQKVIGIDLSGPMLACARETALKEGLSEIIDFQHCDVTHLEGIASASADVVTFLNGAHHFNTLNEVTKVLEEAERVTGPEGMIFVMDPVRQKTRKISDMYRDLSGRDYLNRGMNYFFKDFDDSILASWRPDEFAQVIPKNTNLSWIHIVPFGLPSFQILIGIPKGQRKLFMRKHLPVSLIQGMIPKECETDWQMMKFSFWLASKKWIKKIS